MPVKTAVAAKAAKPRASSGAAAKRPPTGPAGVADLAALSSASGMAAELTKAADALTCAVETGLVCEALDANMQLWVAIKNTVGGTDGGAGDVKDNLVRLADHVVASTLGLARGFSPEAVLPLIGIDLEVAKGLMDGILEHLIRERAYYLWKETGHCSDYDNWIRAEREIRGLFEIA